MNLEIELSIIIVNYNAQTLLKQCLASIAQHLEKVPYEVCVVDNYSSDESVNMIKEDFPDTILVENKQNFGFSKAVNQGIRETHGSFILWFNPDAIFLDEGIKELMEYLKSNSEVGILGPKILDPDGRVQLSCRDYPTYINYFFSRFSILTRLFPKNFFSQQYLKSDWDHSKIRDVDWVSGACLLHRRELVHQVGLLDEGFFMYFEDVDFCRRTHKAGMKVQYHPGSQFTHQIAGSSRSSAVPMLIERHKSLWRYYLKYFSRQWLKDTLIISGIVLRCIVQILSHYLTEALLFFRHMEKRLL